MSAEFLIDGQYFFQASEEMMLLVLEGVTLYTPDGVTRLEADLPVAQYGILGPFEDHESAINATRILTNLICEWWTLLPLSLRGEIEE